MVGLASLGPPTLENGFCSMGNDARARVQRLEEVDALRRRVVELETAQVEHVRTLAALRESEAKFRALLSASTDAYFLETLEGRILDANACACDMYGYTLEEFTNLRVEDLVAEEVARVLPEVIEEELARGSVFTEALQRRKDGTFFPAEVSVRCVHLGGRRLVVTLVRDISEHKRAEAQLRRSRDELDRRVRERTRELSAANTALNEKIAELTQAEKQILDAEIQFRGLFQNMLDFVLVVDQRGKIDFTNRLAEGLPRADLRETVGFDHLVPEHHERCHRALQDTFRTGEIQAVEAQTTDGRWWDCHLVPIENSGGEPRAMIICSDVTERKRAADIVRKEQERLRRLLDMYERDRQLVAYEIHDGLAQPLAGSLMNFEAFAGSLRRRHPDVSLEAFQRAIELLRESVNEARRLMGGLRPAILDEFGIVSAIESLVRDSRLDGVARVDYTHDVQFERLASPLETAIFRILQESLTNARRHSRSSKIRVSLRQQGERLRLETEDWGVGFQPDQVDQGHFGLNGIRERAQLFGGEALIDSAPGKGTRVVVDLPVIRARLDEANP